MLIVLAMVSAMAALVGMIELALTGFAAMIAFILIDCILDMIEDFVDDVRYRRKTRRKFKFGKK